MHYIFSAHEWSSVHSCVRTLLVVACLLLSACSVERHVGDGEYYLQSVTVNLHGNNDVRGLMLDGYIRQQTNTKWFGVKVPMRVYLMSGREREATGVSRILRRIGQAPVLFDSLSTERTTLDMQQVLSNAGYLHGQVEAVPHLHGKRMRLTYDVNAGGRYYVERLTRVCDDPHLEQFVLGQDTLQSLLKVGMPLDVGRLNEERNRLTAILRQRGYYRFTKDDIVFDVDTIRGRTNVALTMHLRLHKENGVAAAESHRQYRIGEVRYLVNTAADSVSRDTLESRGATIVYGGGGLRLRPHLLTANTMLHEGMLYNESLQRSTYNNFMRLGAISYSNLRLREHRDESLLDMDVMIETARPRSISIDLEGTNSAGDLGAAASATFQHKNLLRGSETLTLKLRGAYEGITGLEGYEAHDYSEFGGEMSLNLPGFLFPYISREYGAAHYATSEISLQWNRQNRPEFRRRVLTAAWRYRWQSRNRKLNHRLDLLEVNYIYMPWIATQFKHQYLDIVGSQNAILRYNYENLLITKLGYSYSYSSLGGAVVNANNRDALTVRLGIETSGNVLGGLTKMVDGKTNNNGEYTFCGIAFAQYVKGDIDIAKRVVIDRNNSLAMHAAVGIAYPYGNSSQLPFEKRYFGGGANSVRGWSVRGLGPGAYKGADRQINFLNQCGDIRLDLGVELRSHLFWKIGGAIFVDAGNIWTIRKYDDQPDGEFRFDSFYKQIAASYGIGLRLALDFFTLRFDAGMKAVNPAYDGRDHYPITHPDLKRDFAFHFAVGLPY